MLKNKNFLLTIILPIFISTIIGIIVIVLNSTSVIDIQSGAVINREKREMNSAMSELKKEKKELTYKAAEYDKVLEDNRILLDEITALNDELTEYINNIASAKDTVAQLEQSITDKTEYNESLNNLSGNEQGKTRSYSNVKLAIPGELKSGRYKAEGKGTIMIYTIAGTLQDKQNLSVLDTHSYTFDIISGQTLKIEGTLSLTEIIE